MASRSLARCALEAPPPSWPFTRSLSSKGMVRPADPAALGAGAEACAAWLLLSNAASLASRAAFCSSGVLVAPVLWPPVEGNDGAPLPSVCPVSGIMGRSGKPGPMPMPLPKVPLPVPRPLPLPKPLPKKGSPGSPSESLSSPSSSEGSLSFIPSFMRSPMPMGRVESSGSSGSSWSGTNSSWAGGGSGTAGAATLMGAASTSRVPDGQSPASAKVICMSS
mmetsp:Transcript_103649/g.246770  ORF Transcript_103649/g.246770 Transcript_103649/m.246770 type:complete len:221 (-) Transcript_103649:226-888(-)